MNQDIWQQLLEQKLAKDLEAGLFNPATDSHMKESEHEPASFFWRKPWLIALILGMLVVLFTLFACYMPYYQRRTIIVELQQISDVRTGTDVPMWMNEYFKGSLDPWFPVIYEVEFYQQEVPDYLLDYLVHETQLVHIGFTNCKFQTQDKITAFAKLPSLKWISIVGCERVNFALSDRIKSLNPKMNVNFRGKTFLGVLVNSHTMNNEIIGVESGSPADRAGIMPGDKIIFLAGKPIGNFDDLLRELSVNAVGEPLPLKYQRGSDEIETHVTLVPWPDIKLR